MSDVLRVLFVEDSPDDAALILRSLQTGGLLVESTRVDTADGLKKALDQQTWDIVICDYSLPGFSGLQALQILREREHTTPLIFVSGSIGEDIAVEALKHGAQDYLLKDNLKRLVPAVEREIREARELARLLEDRAGSDAALRASEARFRALIENSHDGILLLTPEKRIAFCSPSVTRILGFQPEELVGRPVQDFFHPDDLEMAVAGFSDCVTGNSNFATCRVRFRHQDGSWRLTDGVCSNLLHDENIGGLVVNFRDVTEAAAAALALQRSEARFSIAFMSSPLATTISTIPEGRYLDANPAFLELLKFEHREVVGHTTVEVGLWVDPLVRSQLVEALLQSVSVEPVSTRYRTKTGEIRDVVMIPALIELDGVPCLLEITQDVTETKRLEAQFRQAQRMEAVGRLAGGIAHDFNNLLMVMGSSAELLQNAKLDDRKVEKYSSHIRDAVDKAARLTRQLLAFSRQQVLQPMVLDLNGIIKDLSKMTVRLLGEDIKVELALAPDLGRVEADRGQVEQVIMNLAVNARDAMPDGGKLTIATSNIEVSADHVDHHQPPIPAGSYVVLAISDIGIGMSIETQSHIFEPFFTTKELGKGTGLGLSTVYGIVKQSNGWIWVYSEPGTGSVFKIYLPRINKALVAERPIAMTGSLSGTETILLVEDEEALRNPVVNYLRSKGYRVIEATDGPTGLETGLKEDGNIDILITDLIMPGFGGVKLAESLLQRHPGLRVTFISGYTDRTANIHDFKSPSSYLQKPFSLDALARAVRSILST